VRVAIRARTSAAPTALASAAPTVAVDALKPTSYNLGVAVGWKRFAVSGDVSKVQDANSALGGRETAVVGVSYSLNRKLTTRVAVGADKSTGQPLPALRKGDNYSLDAGASYDITHRIAVTGGVRYNIEKDRMSALSDARRDSQAVYVGTAFKF
jgi:predicted porin